MFLPGSMEWQAWHFLNTSRPADASPAAIPATADVAEAGDAGGGAVVAPGEGVSFAATWTDDGAAAAGEVEALLAVIWSWTGAAATAAGDGATGFAAGCDAVAGLLWPEGGCEDELLDCATC